MICKSSPRTFPLLISPFPAGLTIISHAKLAVLQGERHFIGEKCHIILLHEAAQMKVEQGALSSCMAGISHDYCQWWK